MLHTVPRHAAAGTKKQEVEILLRLISWLMAVRKGRRTEDHWILILPVTHWSHLANPILMTCTKGHTMFVRKLFEVMLALKNPSNAKGHLIVQTNATRLKWHENNCMQSDESTSGDMSSDGPQNSNVTAMSRVLPLRCLHSSQVYQDKHRTCLHGASTCQPCCAAFW